MRSPCPSVVPLWRRALALLLSALAAGCAAPARPPDHPPTTPAAAPLAMHVYTTAQGNPRFMVPSAAAAATPSRQPLESEVAVFVVRSQPYQTVLGIGGAITDAAADTFARLSPARQAELMTAYFDPERGIGYSLLRTTIHSSDFSAASYTYVDEGDSALASFSIAADRRARLPMIHAALKAAGGRLTTYASPWSAPAWMKDNGSMLQGGKLKAEMAPVWARYITKFVQAYEAEGVPIWGLTVQNEPMARQTWESMIYTAEEERDFLKHHLGPTLQAAGLSSRRIIVWDHNRDLIAQRAQVILSDPEAAKYVWGVGFHWYETWAGGEPMHRNVAAVHERWPQVNLLLTEATVERFNPELMRSWANAERYARQMVDDFNAGAVGWTDWNILLDEHGGPNHVGNFCFAPVHADLRTGELVFTPSYAVLGHFSRFVRPGARRVGAVSSRSMLRSTGFINADGRLAVVVVNTSDDAVNYSLQVGDQAYALGIPAHAIQTLVE
ncbi:glycoside hydrolase family 30 protein [Ideonella sp. BN130291]|uniref:glycoside hydrolase family 30 protein n=1 Tax=Ideonella sp. BN130291 TaxID=3112940 RepID=UPI002E25859E|nr:glycoside hydrolase family 30 protein [Ideonella sp. BN130291]